MSEQEAFIYGYMQGSTDTVLCGMEMTRDEAETAFEQWVVQGEIDPVAIAPRRRAP